MLIKKYFIGLVKYYRGLNDDPEEVLYVWAVEENCQ